MTTDQINKEKLLNILNPEQQKVVTHKDGPLLVLAGAGSGKTRSVIHRVAWLICSERVNPWNILVVTFTNKAAGELRERLEGIFEDLHSRPPSQGGTEGGCSTVAEISDFPRPPSQGGTEEGLTRSDTNTSIHPETESPILKNQYSIKSTWVGTFHSVCVRILRLEIEHLNPYTSDFTIFDRDNQISALKKVYQILDIDRKEYPVEKILSIISNYKSNMLIPENFFEQKKRNRFTELFFDIYVRYNELLKNNNAMDFDDLLLNTVLLLEQNIMVRQKYQDRFKYIMVDEYQDTNHVQFRFIELLSGKHQNICVVGDDDQAIYGWRGADIENILSFEDIFKNATIVKLEQNYRSSLNILNLANNLIEQNNNRHQKELWTDFLYEHVPELISHDNEIMETAYITDDIENKIDIGVNPNEIVVLYRTNAQSRIFESVLARRNIPFQVIGSFSFFKRAEIKDMIAWLRFLVNPNDMEACLRVLNTPPRGIGKTSIDHLVNYSLKNEISFFEAMSNIDNVNVLKPAAKKAFKSFYQMIQNLRSQCIPSDTRYVSVALKLPDIVALIIKECELFEYYKSLDVKEETDKVENIKEFITLATEFDHEFFTENGFYPYINDFLNRMSLQSDVDEFDGKKSTVKLMTMHCAKGLEFEYVYVAGLEEGLLPHVLCLGAAKEIEEERRLLYVAITRAKKEVKLNLAYSRRVAGKVQYQEPSRFLKDISDNVVSTTSINNDFSFSNKYLYSETSPQWQPQKKVSQYKIEDESNHKPYQSNHVLESEKYFQIGQTVEHESYGKGKILNVIGKGIDATLTVSFVNGELKKINGKWVTVGN